MILSISNQFTIFLLSVIFGFCAAFFYDFLVIFRKIIKHYKFFVHIEDFLYWTVLALLMFFIMLEENYGEIRGFLILGVFLGMILYYFSLSEYFLSISDKVLRLIKKILMFLFKLVFTPIEYVFKFFRKIFFFFFGGILKKFCRKNKK